MKLEELLIGQSLIIQLTWGDQKIEFASNVVENDGIDVYLSPYLHNGEPLELNITLDTDVNCNLYTNKPVTGQRVSWKNIVLTTVERAGRILYCAKTSGFNNIAKHDDRRRHDRTIIQIKGQVFDGPEREAVTVVVYDISDNGMSFYAPESFTPQSKQIKVMFSDTINNKEFNIKAECNISRVIKNSGNVFIGGNVVGDNKEYLLYSFLKRLSIKKK